MPAKQDRIRIDLWASLRPIVEAEMERSGLTAQEVVNIALVDYFGLAPGGKKSIVKSTDTQTTPAQVSNESDDYI
jgi:hypothetical protein